MVHVENDEFSVRADKISTKTPLIECFAFSHVIVNCKEEDVCLDACFVLLKLIQSKISLQGIPHPLNDTRFDDVAPLRRQREQLEEQNAPPMRPAHMSYTAGGNGGGVQGE